MHTEVEQFIEKVKAQHPRYFDGGIFHNFVKKEVLEVGSLNINGSVRKYFTNTGYTGIDLAEGEGVDVVCKAHEYDKRDYFNVVISTEMLEHDIHWESSLYAMYYNVMPGGLLLFTCAGPNRDEHGTTRTSPSDSPFTNNYYRNISIRDVQSILPPRLFSEYHIEYQRDKKDLCFYGIKNKL